MTLDKIIKITEDMKYDHSGDYDVDLDVFCDNLKSAEKLNENKVTGY